jgi:hypothetical protein
MRPNYKRAGAITTVEFPVIVVQESTGYLLPPWEDGWYSKSQERENWELICVQRAAVDLMSIQGD